MKISKYIWGLLLISVLGTWFVYPKLPAEVPIHWNIAGEIDRYGAKYYSLLTAILPVFLLLLIKFLPNIDPKKASYEKHKTAYIAFAHVLAVFFVVIHWITVAVALGYVVNVGMVVSFGTGVIFIVLGNYMGQIRHNYFFGIRTPWTLANEIVWTKTHRLGSWIFLLVGLLFIFGGILNQQIGFWISIGSLFIGVAYLTVYSYLEFKRLEQ